MASCKHLHVSGLERQRMTATYRHDGVPGYTNFCTAEADVRRRGLLGASFPRLSTASLYLQSHVQHTCSHLPRSQTGVQGARQKSA